jgi:CBS-domain-containing membrane protein
MARFYDPAFTPGPRENWRGRPSEEGRGFVERAGDEMRSWFGDEEAERRRRMDEYEAERHERQGGSRRPGYSPNGLRAGDLMSRHLLSVHPHERVGHAARLMRDWDCGALPVVDWGGRLLGMVTDRDIAVRLVAHEADARNAAVSDCMTREAFACHADDSIWECLRQMSRHQVRRLPVINDRGQVIGMLSQSDLARHAGVYPGRGERRALANVMCAVSEPTHVSHR